MYKYIIYIIFIIFVARPADAQDFNYVRYDTKDGLAGSTVYDECQDKDGFMWFATENGLSRFDGTNFRNFTVKDGLPDNEVLKLFSDSKGRLWIGSFSKELCYYKDGTFFDRTKDSLLAKMKFNSTIAFALESAYGVVMISDRYKLFIIDADDNVIELNSADIFGKPQNMLLGYYFGSPAVAGDSTIYKYSGGNKFILLPYRDWQARKISNTVVSVVVQYDTIAHKFIRLNLNSDVITGENNHWGWLTFLNSNNGAWEIDSVKNKWVNHFLPGKRISHTFRDREQNLWFSTYGEGVYKLPSTAIKTINPALDLKTTNKEVFSLAAYDDKVISGFGFSKAVIVDEHDKPQVIDFSDEMKNSGNVMQNNRLYCMKTLSGGAVILGFDGFLVKLQNGQKAFNYSYPIKSVDEINREEILVGNSFCAIKIRLTDMKVVDTVWKGRTTKVFFNKNKYYIGTMNGLYEINQDRSYKFLGSINHALTRRIADIKATLDGTMWVATSDEGLVAYRDGKIIKAISDSNGLSSNICKSLFLDNKYLWVGTNKGLNKISLEKLDVMVKYSISDGLPSDVINAVYVKDSMVWVGTPEGVTYFNEKQISNTSVCILKLLDITIGGKIQDEQQVYKLAYNTTNIRFSFAGISFKSGGEIIYHYRMKGLNDEWLKTNQPSLDYQSLPPGDYDLEVYAENKFGIKSDTLLIRLSIGKPYWQTWWFYTLIALVLVGFTIMVVNRRNKKIRLRLEEKNIYQKQFAALEQQALQSQMNPHFIFNCLNSIQQYILTNDKENANRYLTGFASLVRQTLDNSEKSSVTVGEEMEYLKQYLEMEKMRFGDTFVYSIETDEMVQKDFTELPALLLQPYVENSLRHGLRYRDDKSGIVNIRFNMQGETLICSIKDNGVGRKKAAAYKSQQHIEYQSKGMNLTRKRIELLNKMNETNIEVEIKDLANEQGEATGTEVIVKIPV